jgi:hypothetical protein
MEDMEFESRYKIDKERLSKYYERIKNNGKERGSIDHITNFLINQSISSSFEEVFDTLKYYEDKIVEGRGLLDLAFEWIRAQKIRLEYKKYLIRAQYPTNDLCLAVDDCLYRFFLSYDEYIRNLFKKDIREHNFSALYEIFFNTFDEKSLIIEDIVQKHIHNIPSHYYGSNKINTNVMTLRQGLSNIIVKDYVNVLSARKEEEVSNSIPVSKKIIDESEDSNLEKIIKIKNEITEKKGKEWLGLQITTENRLESLLWYLEHPKLQENTKLLEEIIELYFFAKASGFTKMEGIIRKLDQLNITFRKFD